MGFAGILTGTGMMDVALRGITGKITNGFSAIMSSGFVCIVINILTGSDGLNKIIVSELMGKKFLQLRMHPLVLARTLEDFGTMQRTDHPMVSGRAVYGHHLGCTNL